jgi:hypothetical protein
MNPGAPEQIAGLDLKSLGPTIFDLRITIYDFAAGISSS